ncbi:MAG TPA: trypsin-like peptidase domain-containing protein, partial [Kofleriaceae bacterium]|nr:trypsin-like peptidase domain-containing protein [Kofleriaceae bacterium]
AGAKDKLVPIPVGTSGNLKVGQKVFAIGNPFGLDQTLTTGVISGLGREIQSVTRRPIQDVIQTDAAINPGNSGGPLLDSAGRLIGVNTAIYSQVGQSSGIGFAVPVDTVNLIVPQLISKGSATRPGLGVTIGPDNWLRQHRMAGVVVVGVQQGSGAERAGLRSLPSDAMGRFNISEADIIVAMEGKDIGDSSDLFRQLDKHKVGDTVTLTVQNGGKKRDVSVTLEELSSTQ